MEPSPLQPHRNWLRRSRQPLDCHANRELRERAPLRLTAVRRRGAFRAARSLFDPALHVVPARNELVRIEENVELSFRAALRIAAMHEIASDRLRVIRSN